MVRLVVRLVVRLEVRLVARLVELADQHEAAARLGAWNLQFRQRWAVLAAANIYGAIGHEVTARGAAAWDHRAHTSLPAKVGHVARAFAEAMRAPETPETMPKWTRGQLMVMARMEAPPAAIPMTPLRDEEVRPAKPKPATEED